MQYPQQLQLRPTPRDRAQAVLHKLNSGDTHWIPALAELLVDNVHQGACLGFLAPLSRFAAQDYWHQVLARLGPHHQLWIACDGERLQGSVQLSLCPRANAHHRGEVQQLMVHSRARGMGWAGRLMARVECAALAQGRTLLVLDAPAGTQAEAVYLHLDWQRAGEIPGHSACADGVLLASAMYYKRLQLPS
ncbi:GNAT family N-acetyltransferase [Pelomonas sp. SE-A7]|uniref:GNAT family N-acetyltransferase n=1 Tax=Pelomonas sp. SE-A7 TaxID=3054953 RepID=UPI00259D1C5F|nr:GNAT family N-acetyltransferase [Pelomonas sp. SE-A7]MDM4767947.1 GNAT family N-acetyltransferase [Pelomonas sp. SE-A7]